MRAPSSVVLLSALTAAVWPVACGSSGSGGSGFTPDGSTAMPDAESSEVGTLTGDAGGGDGSLVNSKTVTGITITPNQASLASINGKIATQQFQAIAQFSDNTTGPIVGASWSSTNPQIGGVASSSGLYTASGSQGGTATVTASYMGKTATAAVVVKLHLEENPGNVSGSVQSSLQGASALDGQVTWAYPYDATVFPRGVGQAPLMWNGAAATDAYLVTLSSPTFELDSFTTAASGRYDFSPADWASFVDSTTGASELKVTRWNGTAASIITDLHWTVAPGSMRGTIYYWAINTARVMRIQPGATAPDDFLGASVTCPSCHTVSAERSAAAHERGLVAERDVVQLQPAGEQQHVQRLPRSPRGRPSGRW